MERIKDSDRQYFVDWLRVFAVALLIPFHTGMIFCHWGFHLKNDVTSTTITIQNAFLNLWHMPLFFFLSGVGTWYALGFRSAGKYAWERVLRLLFPLVAGIFIVCPPQLYFERLQNGQFSGSFIEFYPTFFGVPYPEGNFSWQHLWFMAYLFLMSLIALPLFRYFRGERGRTVLEKTVDMFSGRFSVYLPVLPFIVIQFVARQGWPNGNQNLIGDLDNFFQHMIVFIYGYMFCSACAFWERVEKSRAFSLVTGAVCCFSVLVVSFNVESGYFSSHIAAGAAMLVMRSISTWCLLLAILGYGRKFLNYRNSLLKYAVEAALPFYILHQTVIILIGFYVVQAGWSVAAKYSFVIITSFIGTVLVYDILVKRWSPVRFLFGMRTGG